CHRAVDGRVFHEAGQPFVGRRFEPEENVEVLGKWPPRLEQRGMGSDGVGAALYQDPPLSDSAPFERRGELQASLRLIPEEVVRDEDGGADRLEVVAYAFYRAE